MQAPPHQGLAGRLSNVLLVEDDDDHAEIVLRVGAHEGYLRNIDRVRDGVEALEYLRRTGAFARAPRPELILLDLKLPNLDGHEVLQVIKGDPELRSIPVVVLTTSNAESDRAKAYDCCANSYIVKPVSLARFRQMMRDLSVYWGEWSPPAGC